MALRLLNNDSKDDEVCSSSHRTAIGWKVNNTMALSVLPGVLRKAQAFAPDLPADQCARAQGSYRKSAWDRLDRAR